MHGLICKEFIYFKRQNPITWVSIIFCIFIFCVVNVPQRDARMWGLNICMVTSLLGNSFLVGGPFFDDKSHWDRFARSLPVSPRKIVGSRYLCAAFIIATGTLLSIGAALAAVYGRTDWDTFSRIASFCVGVPAIMDAVYLPLCYLLHGPAIAYAAAIAELPLIVMNVSYQCRKCADPFSLFAPLPFLLVSAVIMAVSFFLSVRIYSQKEM